MHPRRAIDKILPRQELALCVEDARAAGRKIAFTNGCFDLLHVGHARYLQEARALGDLLIVATNDDRGIAELKGAGRPILPENERALILAALAAVDYVTIFSEPTPHALLHLLRPDVLVKGGDYGVDGIIGREVVWEYGGEVQPLCVAQGLSTTGIIQRCQGLRAP